MIEDHRERAEAVFLETLTKPVTERTAFAEHACAGEPEVLQEVLSLLESAEDAESYLAALAAGAGAPSRSERQNAGPRLEGQRIGPYRLVRELGRGGIGTVYLAERADGDFEQRVAIKLLRRGLDTDDILARFRAERQILASLNHPHIARLFDGGATEDGRPYLVMELVEGLPITEYCDRRRCTIGERLRLFVQVARAAQHAHRNLIVHRDIKPSNILVTQDGTPKLLDFGIAKLLDMNSLTPDPSPQTRTGMRLMTPEYASPEQLRGEPVTTASDAYQLGVLLYRLLAGRRPYRLRGRAPEEIERVICEQEPMPPGAALALTRGTGDVGEAAADELARLRRTDVRRLRSRLRGDLGTILLKAVRKEPERRYTSAAELADDIERYLNGRPVAARPDTWGYRARKFVGRRPGVVAAATAILALILGSATMMMNERAETERERDQAQAAAEAAEVQARKAERVTEFLASLFAASDPGTAQGRDPTARELLERGVAEIDLLGDDPQVQAELLAVISGVYRSLGSWPQSLQLAERALELRRELFGEEHLAVAQSLNDVANLLRRMSDLDGAEQFHRQALDLRRKLLGDEHLDVAASMNNLGVVLERKDELDQAERLYRAALALNRALLGDEHLRVAGGLHNLGVVLEKMGDLDGAAEINRQSLALWQKVGGEDHPNVAASLYNLGEVYRLREEYPAAEDFHRQALALWRKVLGEEHPNVASGLTGLGRVLHARGDLSQAERVFRESLAMQHTLLGAEHANTVQTREYLSDLVRAMGDHAAAEALP